jgi:hypothetical protein
MHFGTKSYLKSTRNHTTKHALSIHKERKQVYHFIYSFLTQSEFQVLIGSLGFDPVVQVNFFKKIKTTSF